MHTKKRIIFISAISVVIIGLALFVARPEMTPPAPTEPVALVNGAPITFSELQREIKKTRDYYALQNVFPDKSELKQMKKDVLDRLIQRELLWQHAVQEGLTVNEESVSAELDAMKKRYGNEAVLNNMLKNKKMSRQEFVGLIKRDLTIQTLIDGQIAEAITISEAECRNFYQNNLKKYEVPESVRASHLCIFVKDNAPKAEKRKAEATIRSLEDRLKKGERFEDLAREASQCVSSERGGDLGFITRGAMDPDFEKAAFAMTKNEVSPIVRSSMGYHIIKVTDREPARIMTFDEVKNSVAQHLKELEINRALEQYVADLEKQADVKRML